MSPFVHAIATNEIGSNTVVRLGVVAAVGMALLGGVMWAMNVHEHVSILEHRAGSIETAQKSDREAVEKRLDRIESKLDKALERKP